jgi:deoxyribonuclease-4
MPVFGPAGSAQSFYDQGYKRSDQMPDYLSAMGLTAYEYQCGRGVNISDQKARLIGERFREKGIAISLHAPYYISLSGTEEAKRLKSIDYILQSAKAVSHMGGNRIVVHSGSASKITRQAAMELAADTVTRALKHLDDHGLGHVHICLETMGKIGQLGTLEEVLTLCQIDERLLPCIDFGHLNARTLGGLKCYEDYEVVFEATENALGIDRLRRMHVHFSKIAYTKAGEQAHLTFEDSQYGPDFGPVAELTYKKSCRPVFICESAGTQAEDALTMMRMYQAACAAPLSDEVIP